MALEFGTKQVSLTWGEVLKGWRAAYLTRLSDGHRKAYGRGSTRVAAEREAERNWIRLFEEKEYRQGEYRGCLSGSTSTHSP